MASQASTSTASRAMARVLANLLSERIIFGTLGIALFFSGWEAVVRLGLADPLFVSAPSRIYATGVELLGTAEMWDDIAVSTTEFIAGYLWAIAVAVPLGLAVGWSKRMYYIFGPVLDALNAVPRVTLLPLIVIWFGIGLWSKFAVVFLGAVVPIAIYTYSGVKTNEARFLRVARSFGASPWKLFTSIIVPGTVPFIFTGMKYGAGRALLGVVVGELYASTHGVGHMIAMAGNAFQADVVFFGVLLFTAAGLATVSLLDAIERRFERWRPDQWQ